MKTWILGAILSVVPLHLVGCQLGTETEEKLSSSSSLMSSQILSSSSQQSFLSSEQQDAKDFEFHCPMLRDTAKLEGRWTAHCSVISKSQQPLSLRLKRETLVLPESWAQLFCFGLNCYPDFVSESDIQELASGDSMDVSIYVDVTQVRGNATFKMVVEEVTTLKTQEASFELVY
jgi:hypothetical protein